MKPFNKSLYKDITELKELYASSGPRSGDYKEKFRSIMQHHKISRTTMFEELSKDVPGAYRTRDRISRIIQVSGNEIQEVKELIYKRKSYQEIRKTMELSLGFPYSERRLLKVKKLIALGIMSKLKVPNDGIKEPEDGVKGMNPPETVAVKPAVATKPIINNLFYTLSGFDLTDNSRIHDVELGGDVYKVSNLVVKESLAHIAASASNSGMHIHEVTRFEMESLLLWQIKQVRLGRLITPAGLKQLESIRKSLDRQDSTAEKSAMELEAVYKTVKLFAPNALRSDIMRVFEESVKGIAS